MKGWGLSALKCARPTANRSASRRPPPSRYETERPAGTTFPMIPKLTIRRGRMRNMSGAKPGPSTSPPLVSTLASPRTKQHIMDEPNSRLVEPELLYEFVSMVLCTPNAQLVGLTVDAFQPLVHLEHFA